MCGLILASPLLSHVCLPVCIRQGERKRETLSVCSCVFVSVWEMLRRGAGLYRLATPVHRGQSASNRKYVYKWGSYFYCFCHFTRSTISLILSPSASLSFFSGTSSYFSSLSCPPPSLLPAFVRWSLKVHKLAFRSSSPLLAEVSRPPRIHQGFSCPGFPTVRHSVQGTAPGPACKFSLTCPKVPVSFYFNQAILCVAEF